VRLNDAHEYRAPPEPDAQGSGEGHQGHQAREGNDLGDHDQRRPATLLSRPTARAQTTGTSTDDLCHARVVQHAYQLAWPHPRLAGLVVQYLGYDEHSSVVVQRHQVPSGACTLVLSLGSLIRMRGPAGPVVRRSFFAGMHDVPVVTEYSGTQAGVEAVLTPLGALILLGQPMGDLTNRTPSLTDLDGPALAELPAQLEHARVAAAMPAHRPRAATSDAGQQDTA
jgi:hypothetical protein